MELDMERLKKQCQVCRRPELLVYKLNQEHYCPICTRLASVIAELSNATYTYCYCHATCKVAFRYHRDHKHHTLHQYGNLYHAEIIDRYTLNGLTTHQLPVFVSQECFVAVNNNENSRLHWKGFYSEEGCCICFEPTTHTTECGHPLCETCIPSLIGNICPICRKVLTYIQEPKKEEARRGGTEDEETGDEMIF